MSYYHRNLEKTISQASLSFPAIVVTGPRQSGKTTLLKHLSKKTHTYISLEDPDVRQRITSDPRGFLSLYKGHPLFLDEIQYVPDLLPYIKSAIDRDRKPGWWLLSGSQHFSLMAGVSESLAGRAAILSLLPFSWNEFYKSSKITEQLIIAERIIKGFYPQVLCDAKTSRDLWCASYIQTYLERDVRAIVNVANLSVFERFLRMIALRTGQLLNLSELARDTGITNTTAQRWLSILETSTQVFLLQPYFRNLGKRLVKSPKLYFLDTGLASYLFGLHDPKQLLHSPYWGNLFETFIISEWIKLFKNRGHLPPLYFWKSSDGYEIDLLIDFQGILHSFEIKSTQTPTPQHALSLAKWRERGAENVSKGTVLCNITEKCVLQKDIYAEPWIASINSWRKKFL